MLLDDGLPLYLLHACLQARKTANSWRAVDLQSSSGSSADGAKRFACLKPLVRRGIPIELRPSVWPLISGAAAKQAAAGPGAYGRLVEAAATGLPRNTQYTLKEDLSPTCFTFWTHPAFRNGSSGLERLQRLLGAYLTHNPGTVQEPSMPGSGRVRGRG